MRKDILKFSGVLLGGLLLEFWIVYYSPLNLPERLYVGLPGDATKPSVKVSGLLLVALLLTILTIAEKKFLRNKSERSILNLTLIGAIICFIAEVFFQAIRQPFIDDNTMHSHIYYFLLSVVSMTFFGAVLSFFIAFQLKTKKTGQLILIIIAFALVMKGVMYLIMPLK